MLLCRLSIAAEFGVIDKFSVGGSSFVVKNGNVAIGTDSVGGARLAVIGSADTAYSLAIGTSAAYNVTISTCGDLRVNGGIYKGTYSVLDSSMLDGFTLKIDTATNKIRLADRIEENILRNAFQAAVLSSMSIYGMTDGFMDDFEDQSGIDAGASSGYQYNSSGRYFSPSAGSEIDYMEYGNDSAAQAAYVTNDAGASDSYTKLFLHCNGTSGSTSFIDSSPNKYPVTPNGDVKIDTSQYKFGGASAYFDGAGDYLTVPDSDDWTFGTGSFTIDFWARVNSSETFGLFGQYLDGSSRMFCYWDKNWQGVFFHYQYNGAIVIQFVSSWIPSLTEWQHIAFVRKGTSAGDWLFFVNGQEQSSSLTAGSWDAYLDNIAHAFSIGNEGGGTYFNGWLDDFRISKGIARWTTNFNPPRAPDEYTKLLLHFDGNDNSTVFVDEAGKDVTRGGTAKIVTGLKKFGNASGYFNGSGDQLVVPDSDDWNFGTGDFTIDCWVNINARLDADQPFVTQCSSDFNNRFHFEYNPSFGLYFDVVYNGSYLLPTFYQGNTSGWSLNTWYHVAVVRYGNVWNLYRDGISLASKTISFTMPDFGYPLKVGTLGTGAQGYDFHGNIDEVRVSKGVARWTANFPQPQAPYLDFQAYSSTISSQGTYSLKAVAFAGASLNDTLTKTTSTINLSGMNSIKFDIRSSRTGENIQAQIHNSGGAVSSATVNILAPDIWQTVNWDLSGVQNTDKNAIDRIVFKVINDSADNFFYVDNMLTGPANMILVSTTVIAADAPSKSRIVLFEEDVDNISLNTDLKAYASRYSTSSWSEVTLSNDGNYETGKRILSGIADISTQTSSATMRWKVTTHNTRNLKLYGVGLTWD